MMMSYEEKVQNLKNDILRYRKACKSAWPAPSDYTKLIDAQYALRDLQKGPKPQVNLPQSSKPLTWLQRL